jgi:FMN phosphatase YigB (HAD superfamily)
MAKYYCVLFDADNTLLDFDAAENKALADTLREYGIEPDAETVQTYRTINEELWRQLEKGQIRRDKLMGERFTRFLKAVNAAGNGVEMNKFYLDQLSTHPDLTSPNVLDVLRELSEVATLAVVTNGFDRVQSRRVRDPAFWILWRMCSFLKKWTAKSPTARFLMPRSVRWAWRTVSMC